VVLVGREVKGANASTTRYYVTSLRATAAGLGRLVRRHGRSRTSCTGAWMWHSGRAGRRRRPGHTGANVRLGRPVAASLLKQNPE
jgi:hypothetical protein